MATTEKKATKDVAKTDEEAPETTGGDIDISTLSTKSLPGEHPALIIEGTWGILDGAHEDVPEEVGGHLATVIEAPLIYHNSDDFSNRPYATNDPDRKLTVRTRDQYNVLLEVAADAFLETATERAELLPIG